MAATTENVSADMAALSARETRILVAAVLSMNLEDTKLDMEKFIKHSGFANANSARVQWSGVKKKVLSMAGEDGFVAPANASTPTPRKRKPKATATDEGGTEENGSPTKKARTPKKKAVAKEKGSDEDKDTKKDEKKHEADGEDTSMKKVEEN